MINKDGIYSMLRSLLGSFQFFVISVFVIQLTSVAVWGNFISMYLVWSMIVLLINSGTKEFLVKSISQHPAQIWTILSQNTSLRFLLSVIACALVYVLYQHTNSVKVIMTVIIILRVFTSSLEGLIVFHKSFKQSFFVELVVFVMICGIIFWGNYVHSLTPIYVLFCIGVGDVLKLILYELIFSFFRKIHLTLAAVKNSFIELAPFIGIGIIGLIMNKADLYLLGMFETNHETIGQYQILNTFCNMLIVLVSAFVLVRNKILYRIRMSTFLSIRKIYFYYVVVFVILATVVFYVVSPFLFHYRLMIYQLCLVMITVIIYSWYSFDIFLLLRFNRAITVNKVLAASAAVCIVFGLFLIPTFHIDGALVAVALANLTTFIGFKFTPLPTITESKSRMSNEQI